jgi:Glycosyltransferase
MRIGIDARPLQTGHKYRGIGRDVYQKLKALRKIDKDNQYFLFIDKKLSGTARIKEEFEGENFGVIELFFSFPAFIDKVFLDMPTMQFVIPIEIKRKKLDIFYSFDYFIPLFPGAKFVNTIYGLNPFIINNRKRMEMEKKFRPVNSILDWAKILFKKFQSFLLLKIIFGRVRTGFLIITISENSKKDIMAYFNLPSDKIYVIPEGVDTLFFKPAGNAEIKVIKEKYAIKYSYFLFVSAVEWLKNVQNAIMGYILAKKKFLFPHQLVIVGIHGIGFDIFKEMVRENNLEEEIIFTGYIPDKDIVCLYSGAEAHILPSFYEGFGITVLEAMACGCPVLASKTSCMPEVIGNAGLYFDPEKPEEISRSMVKIEGDKILRKKLVEKGYQLVKKFTWDSSAQRLVRVFEEVYNK